MEICTTVPSFLWFWGFELSLPAGSASAVLTEPCPHPPVEGVCTKFKMKGKMESWWEKPYFLLL